MIVADVRHMGTMVCSREMIKRLMKTAASCNVQYFSTSPGTPSGPAALLGLMWLRTHFSS